MQHHSALDVVQLLLREPVVERERHWLQPKLGALAITLYVDMPRLRAIGCEKRKPIRPFAKYRWHSHFPIIYTARLAGALGQLLYAGYSHGLRYSRLSSLLASSSPITTSFS